MKQMYIINCRGGCYDDCWTSSLYITGNLKKGEQFVNEKNLFISKCQKAKRKLDKVSSIYDIHNPEPCDWDKEETLELNEKWHKTKNIILKEWLIKHFTIDIVNELINDTPFYEQILDQYYSIDLIKVL